MNGEHIYNIAHLAIEEIASNLNNDMQSSINYNPHSNPVDEIVSDGAPTHNTKLN